MLAIHSQEIRKGSLDFRLGLGSSIICEVNQWWILGWLLGDLLLGRWWFGSIIVVIVVVVQDDETFTRLGVIIVVLIQDALT
jgi:hypothetical protein